MTTHKLLVAAKTYLLTHGWAQVSYGHDGGPRCMNGALWSAGCRRGTLDFVEARAALEAAIDRPHVFAWNDVRGRTFTEVIDAFDRAIVATAPKDTPAPAPAPMVEAPA